MATIPLNVPDHLIPRVMPAFRATFPDLTGDASGQPLGDGLAYRAVVKHLTRQVVMAYEGNQVRETQRNQVTDAEQSAFAALDAIS